MKWTTASWEWKSSFRFWFDVSCFVNWFLITIMQITNPDTRLWSLKCGEEFWECQICVECFEELTKNRISLCFSMFVLCVIELGFWRRHFRNISIDGCRSTGLSSLQKGFSHCANTFRMDGCFPGCRRRAGDFVIRGATTLMDSFYSAIISKSE